MTPRRFMRSLRRLYSVPVGLLLGVLLALIVPGGAPYVAWIGQIFLSLLVLLILPLILVSIYATLSGGHELRRIGGRTLLYYLTTSAIAATLGTTIGLVLSSAVEPGLLDLPPIAPSTAGFSLERLVANLVPSNLFASLAEGNILHVVVVAILFALASRRLATAQRETLLVGARALDALLMQVLHGVLALAPLGIAALIYGGLAGLDWAEILELHAFVWAVALAVFIHAGVVLPTLLRLRARRPAWRFALDCRAPLLTALSTASSSATYPVSKQTLEATGVSERVTAFTLPLGATLNMDGSALYQSILLIFMSQLAGVELTLLQALFIVLLTMASSAGTAGIPGGGIALMAFMLDLLGLPQTYLALYLVVDRFFDYPITAINVWGDLVVAAVVDRELRVKGERRKAKALLARLKSRLLLVRLKSHLQHLLLLRSRLQPAALE